jgi:hypothetical protein
MLEKQTEGCALSKGDSLCYRKKNVYFPSPLFGIFDFFCLFQFFKCLKKNKRMLCHKGGTSVAKRKLALSAWNTLILMARRHVQDKDTQGKFFHGSRCQVAKARSVVRLAYKECFKGSVERNMESALGQRHKMRLANAIKQDTMRPLLCIFYEPREGKLGIFFTFRESEKMKKKTPGSTFFGNNLVGSKNG